MNLFKKVGNFLAKKAAVKYLAKVDHNPYSKQDAKNSHIQDAEFEEAPIPKNLLTSRNKALLEVLTEDDAANLLATGYLIIRINLAMNASFPWAKLGVKLVKDSDHRVREAVAGCCANPTLLRMLKDDSHEEVLWELANNKSTPKDVLDLLKQHKDTTLVLAASIDR